MPRGVYIRTPEMIAKLGRPKGPHPKDCQCLFHKKGNIPWNKDKPGSLVHSEKTKKQMSQAHKGQKAWNKGIPMREESKRKLSESNRGEKSSRWKGGISKQEDYNARRRLRRNYKMTLEQYDTLLKSQENVCAICGKIDDWRVLAVDHDHSTGVVRGLLCNHCNLALGMLKDDVSLFMKSIEYLKQHAQ